MTASSPSPERFRGFTLIELAVVMFVIALLLGSIVVPLRLQVESRNYDQTRRILDQAREALLGYAAANGRFPCPASANAITGAGNGVEDGNATTGICSGTVTGPFVYYGFLPAATLGFTPVDANGYALDAWGLNWKNRIRYAVSSVNLPALNPTFTKPNGMRTATMSSIAAATNLLYVCNSSTGASSTVPPYCAVTLASSVPVVIWSVGPNAATSGGASDDEKRNPNSTAGFIASRIFVSTSKREAGETGGEFDDIVTWIGLPILFSRMIAAGQLP